MGEVGSKCFLASQYPRLGPSQPIRTLGLGPDPGVVITALDKPPGPSCKPPGTCCMQEMLQPAGLCVHCECVHVWVYMCVCTCIMMHLHMCVRACMGAHVRA